MVTSLRTIVFVSAALIGLFYVGTLSFAESPSQARSPCPQMMKIHGNTVCFPDLISKLNFFAEISKENPRLGCNLWLCEDEGEDCFRLKGGALKFEIITCGGGGGGSPTSCDELAPLCNCEQGPGICMPVCGPATNYSWRCATSGGCKACGGAG